MFTSLFIFNLIVLLTCDGILQQRHDHHPGLPKIFFVNSTIIKLSSMSIMKNGFWFKRKIPHVNVVNVSDADYLLFEYTIASNNFLDLVNALKPLHDFAKNSNKPMIVFVLSDREKGFQNTNNLIIFRTSILKSTRNKNEYVYPYLTEGSPPYPPLGKDRGDGRPIVGFQGSCGNNTYRYDLIEEVTRNPLIQSNITVRKSFGFFHMKGEFEENIRSSHFVICSRGAGNWSMRFYQVLEFGRIPILIDSDMLFPFESEIDWDSIIVRGRNSSEVVRKLLDWWNNRDVVEIQRACRRIHETYFTRQRFFSQITNIISNYQLASRF